MSTYSSLEKDSYTHTDTVGVPSAPIPGEIVLIHEDNRPHTW